MLSIAINGFGRIGKTFVRTIMQDPDARKKIKVVSINIGPSDPALVAHYFKYDTLMGIYPGSVVMQGSELIIDGTAITIHTQLDPATLPWKKEGIDVVVECTGKFTSREGASKHLTAGARSVLISAPATGHDIAIIPGVNQEAYDPAKHRVISLGSCTTNALVPLVHLLHENFKIAQAFMTTVHAYTNTQALLDVDMGEARRNRAAALNLVPTTTGATEVIGQIIPELEGLVLGHAVRVPVGKVSLIDLAFIATKPISAQAINDLFLAASQGKQRGVVALTNEPLVSSDYFGNSYSVTVDGSLTQTIDSLGKVFGWYDNEWGYSERLKDFLLYSLNR